MEKRILIATPYLKNIGGTEIEAVFTAIYLYDSKFYNKIILFTPNNTEKSLFQNIIRDRKIEFLTYPVFFSYQFTNLINRLFFKLGFRFKIAEYIYWKLKSIKISTFFILTYPKSSYFFPILHTATPSKKIIGKITMGQFDILPKSHINFYRRFDRILVFNNKQKDFWMLNYEFDQVFALDIMIPNETNLLKVKFIKTRGTINLVFGFLGRISREKNIMDMILLLDILNNKNNYKCKLIIQGEGDSAYIKELMEKIKLLNLSEFVIFNNWFIDPMLTHEFFNEIDIFLVTSKWEGGPITSLEAAAAGRIVLGYDVGSMKDRFNKFPFMVNNNFEELCNSAMAIINMDIQGRNEMTLKIKEYYLKELSNHLKGETLMAFINK